MNPNNSRVFGQDAATPSRSFEEVKASAHQARDPTYVLPPRAQLFQGRRGRDRSNKAFYDILEHLDKYMIPNLGQDNYHDYLAIGWLGEGGFGEVHLMRKKYGHQKFAVKRIDPICLIDETRKTYLRREASAMLALRDCPFTCKLHEFFLHENYVYFVLELASNGPLSGWVQRCGGLNEGHTLHYASEIVQALKYLREKELVHRDIKAQNILINERYHALLSDFGVCKSVAGDEPCAETIITGTYCLCPPEILDCQPTQFSNDLWTFGCLLYYMRCNARPFHRWERRSRHRLFLNIKAGEWDRNLIANENPHFRDLVEKLIVLNPKERLGANNIFQLMAHPYFIFPFEQYPGVTLPPIEQGFYPPYIPETVRSLLAQAPHPTSWTSPTQVNNNIPETVRQLLDEQATQASSSFSTYSRPPSLLSPLSTSSTTCQAAQSSHGSSTTCLDENTTCMDENSSLTNHMRMSASPTNNRPVPMMIDNAANNNPPPTINQGLPLDQYFASQASSANVQGPRPV